MKKQEERKQNTFVYLAIGGFIFVTMILLLSRISSPQSKSFGGNELTKAEAEQLAVSELKRIVQNAFEHEKNNLYQKFSTVEVAEFEKQWQQGMNSIYAAYSTKQGDAWHVYLEGAGKDTAEVVVYSHDNIQIPKLEEILRNP